MWLDLSGVLTLAEIWFTISVLSNKIAAFDRTSA